MSLNKINKKSYIGLTKGPFEYRRKQHLYSTNNGSECYFHRALRKYGSENFEWTILDSSAKTIEELKQLEIDYIAKLKPEYNMTAGGDGFINPCEETLRRRSNSLSGRVFGEEHKRKISNKLKGRTSPMKGKTFSHKEESKKRISEGIKRFWANKKKELRCT